MVAWNESRIRELTQRLEDFRRECRVTTLAEEEKSRSPFRLLVACVISLRTKDEVTAEASARLFAIAPDADRLAKLDVESIAKAIYPAGFYNTKARQLNEIGRTLLRQHDGEVPGPTWSSASVSTFPPSASTPTFIASRIGSGS
jgi:endonuclease-3